MKKPYKVMSAVLIAGALVGGGLVNSTLASEDAEKKALKTATEYVEGFQADDINKMMKNVKDTRVQDEAKLKSKYEYYSKRNKETHAELKFVDLEKVDAKTFKATFELSDDHFQNAQFSLPVIEENGQWKLLVDGSVVLQSNKQQKG